MEKAERPILPPGCELEPREQMDSLHVGVPERAQVADDRSRRRGSHLKIDRPAGKKSSLARPMTSGTKPGLSIRSRSRTTGKEATK
jgi:hypothetical protein